MNILVTAGNTLVPIDRVRCISNIFTGRTGTRIALYCHQQGHHVHLLTSHPALSEVLSPGTALAGQRWYPQVYRTFDDLSVLMEETVTRAALDVIIHSAAVSDYSSAGIFAAAAGTQFSPEEGTWTARDAAVPTLLNRAAGKVKSDEPELWLRLVRTPKLIDALRTAWGYRGLLVKFKLEVGVGEMELLEIAEASRRQSQAELMVANTLEGSGSWAFLGPLDGNYERVSRRDLPERLLAAVERLRREGRHA
jgi:phosphopantothenoylcysteine synthetase/decarboxylase